MQTAAQRSGWNQGPDRRFQCKPQMRHERPLNGAEPVAALVGQEAVAQASAVSGRVHNCAKCSHTSLLRCSAVPMCTAGRVTCITEVFRQKAAAAPSERLGGRPSWAFSTCSLPVQVSQKCASQTGAPNIRKTKRALTLHTKSCSPSWRAAAAKRGMTEVLQTCHRNWPAQAWAPSGKESSSSDR